MRRDSFGGGCLIALSLVAGTVAGVVLGEGSLGLLIGLGAGLAAAGLLAWFSRNKNDRSS